MKHVPNGCEERETGREGTREPVNKTAREGTPEPREQKKRAMPTAGEQHVKKRVEVNDKVWEKNLNVSAEDKSNVIINMNLQGNCLSPRQRISEMRMRPISRRSRSYEMCEILVSCSMNEQV